MKRKAERIYREKKKNTMKFDQSMEWEEILSTKFETRKDKENV